MNGFCTPDVTPVITRRRMKTPAAWVGKRIHPDKWHIPAGYAVNRSTGRLAAVKPAAPLAASRRVDGKMRRAAAVETYSSARPVNLFSGGYQPDRTPTIADRRAYGFDAAIVAFHFEQETATKVTFTLQPAAVVFTVGMMDNRHAGTWFASAPVLAAWLNRDALTTVKSLPFAAGVVVEPVRYRVSVGSIRARVPFTPEYCVTRCLLSAFYALNPDYRALQETQAACQLPVARAETAAAHSFASQRSPSARRVQPRKQVQRAKVAI